MIRSWLILALTFLLAPLTRAQANKPAPPPSVDDAQSALRARTLPIFALKVEDALKAELARPKPDGPTLTRLATLRVFAKRFGTLKEMSEEDSTTAAWLIKHPTLAPLLLTALSEKDDAARVLSLLTALRKQFTSALDQFPDLAVATCVVWDTSAREQDTPAQAVASACAIFGHLTRNARSMKVDVQTLPWPVAVYLVDSRISSDERTWATRQYRLPSPPGQAYFHVRYDMSSFKSGQWGRNGQPYTLQNLLKLGGVCKDEAYFAAEVCRANGIPAAICTGQSSQGEGFHAWVGLLSTSGKRITWNFDTARYPEHGFWSGTVIDPQTGNKQTDGDVAMTAEWKNVTPARRLMSLALTQSLDLVDSPRRIALSKLAIETAPCNQQAWMILSSECLNPTTPLAQVQEVSVVVEREVVGHYDDFAYKVLKTLVSARKPDEQLAALDRASRLFPRRPDLLADIMLTKGDALRKASREKEALKTYQTVLEKSLRFEPLLLEAMTRVDDMLRPAGQMRDLLEHYRVVWGHMPTPEASGYIWTTPWYIMGDRYAQTLDDTGDKTAAEKVRRTIRARDLSPPEDK